MMVRKTSDQTDHISNQTDQIRTLTDTVEQLKITVQELRATIGGLTAQLAANTNNNGQQQQQQQQQPAAINHQVQPPPPPPPPQGPLDDLIRLFPPDDDDDAGDAVGEEDDDAGVPPPPPGIRRPHPPPPRRQRIRNGRGVFRAAFPGPNPPRQHLHDVLRPNFVPDIPLSMAKSCVILQSEYERKNLGQFRNRTREWQTRHKSMWTKWNYLYNKIVETARNNNFHQDVPFAEMARRMVLSAEYHDNRRGNLTVEKYRQKLHSVDPAIARRIHPNHHHAVARV
jgi:hypothetical protein